MFAAKTVTDSYPSIYPIRAEPCTYTIGIRTEHFSTLFARAHGTMPTPSVVVPTSLEFACQRVANQISSDMKEQCQLMSAGLGGLLLRKDFTCTAQQHLGACANRFGNRSECSCPELDRRAHPEIRAAFEAEAIATMTQLIKTQPQPFVLHIVVSSPGELFGEEILLVKLFDTLRILGLTQGVLRLSLIDEIYQENITEFTRQAIAFQKAMVLPRNLSSLLHGDRLSAGGHAHAAAIEEFASDLSKVVPKGITLRISLFASVNDYTSQRVDAHLPCILLGSDIGDGKAYRELQSAHNWNASIALFKDTYGPLLSSCGVIKRLSYAPATNLAAHLQPIPLRPNSTQILNCHGQYGRSLKLRRG